MGNYPGPEDNTAPPSTHPAPQVPSGYSPPPSRPLGAYPPPPSQPLGAYPPPMYPPYAPPPMPSQPLVPYAPAPTGYPAPPQTYTGPMPGYAPPPYPVPPVVYVVPRRSNGGAVAVEAILAFFGIYGVGWLMVGETTAGALLLAGSFLWWNVTVVTAIFTFGLGLFCIAPLNIAFLITSAVLLSNHTARQP